VNEQARRLQMCVAGEIEVVNLCALEDGCLLKSDVRREQQEPVVGVIGRQIRSAAVQLFDDDSDILLTEMPLLLHDVPKAIAARSGLNFNVERVRASPMISKG
jgi:hypothetical protein